MQTLDNQLVIVHGKQFRSMISAEEIATKVAEIGAEITEKYAGKRPLLLSILNGAFMFAADLSRAIDTELELTFIKLASYKGTGSTGKVETVLGLDMDLTDRHIIIVEDIIDTGLTLHNFLKALEKEKPASVSLCTCFFKKEALQYPLSIDYVLFEITNKFIIGYGLDYDGLGRNLPAVYQINE
jgi:hypoxanthine phosphoribosyltransferase